MSEENKDLSMFIHAIQERFEPVENENEATHKLSTMEVKEVINELNPGLNASTQETYDALFEAGFVFRSPRGTVGLHFKWLMKER